MSDVFSLTRPSAGSVPILLSVPHCGTRIPEDLRAEFIPEKIAQLDDTDWFVDQLYDFAPTMGITLLSARYSRWVIDLNRTPDNQPLYTDGRVITGLCPVTDFLGDPIYTDARTSIDVPEVERRKNVYYHPYHDQIRQILKELQNQFGKVLLWDCHSIRRFVPSIRKDPFPDLILGDADGTSASPGLTEITLRHLEGEGRVVSHNHPFKGGYITRHYGKPMEQCHALQLEMSKVNYMDDEERNYHPQRAERIRELLKRNFEELITLLLS
jgi:N-formylglutamate amidohydrolase